MTAGVGGAVGGCGAGAVGAVVGGTVGRGVVPGVAAGVRIGVVGMSRSSKVGKSVGVRAAEKSGGSAGSPMEK